MAAVLTQQAPTTTSEQPCGAAVARLLGALAQPMFASSHRMSIADACRHLDKRAAQVQQARAATAMPSAHLAELLSFRFNPA